MEKISEGAYGAIYSTNSGERVVKVLKPGRFWGEFELVASMAMSDCQFAPKVYSVSPSHIEMEAVPGKPLWGGGYKRTPEEKERDLRLTAEQTLCVLNALKALHLAGFYHGDMHNGQVLTDGEGGSYAAVIDFGLCGQISKAPHKVLNDFTKVLPLLNIHAPELDGDKFVSLIRTSTENIKIAGRNTKKRAEVCLKYLNKLKELRSNESNHSASKGNHCPAWAPT